jgi:hypothetical protein
MFDIVEEKCKAGKNMTEEEFISYFGEDVKVTLHNGHVLVGHVCSFTWAADNEPEVAELDLKVKGRPGLICVTQDEVKSIEIIKDQKDCR